MRHSMALKNSAQSARTGSDERLHQSTGTARQSAFLEALGTVITLAIFLLPAAVWAD